MYCWVMFCLLCLQWQNKCFSFVDQTTWISERTERFVTNALCWPAMKYPIVVVQGTHAKHRHINIYTNVSQHMKNMGKLWLFLLPHRWPVPRLPVLLLSFPCSRTMFAVPRRTMGSHLRLFLPAVLLLLSLLPLPCFPESQPIEVEPVSPSVTTELYGNDSDEAKPPCSDLTVCSPGILLPVWLPHQPGLGEQVARAIVYFVSLIYMFLGVSIIADRFMASIEVITSQVR